MANGQFTQVQESDKQFFHTYLWLASYPMQKKCACNMHVTCVWQLVTCMCVNACCKHVLFALCMPVACNIGFGTFYMYVT